MPAIHARQPIPDAEAALRIAEEAVQRPWKISAEQRAIIVQRMVQVVESADPLLAIKAAWVFLAMDKGNRAAARLLAQLDEQYGPPMDAALEALARRLDAPKQPAVRAIAS
jgi:hypothetical protein